jgi:putative intracellular protease/amidase
VAKRRVLVPLPDRDFDVTEVAVPWKMLTHAGHEVVFATEAGMAGPRPAADTLLLSGVVVGKLGADSEPKRFYGEMLESAEIAAPVAWGEVRVEDFDALVLPGGHAPGMKQYLGSPVLRERVAAFWKSGRPVAAICHGVLVLARASVLGAARTTCLPKYMERLAYGLTFWKVGRYYRTYPAYVEDEVRAALADPARQFERGPVNLGKRATADDDTYAFVVEDGRYVSARWPGDAYLFARKLLERL